MADTARFVIEFPGLAKYASTARLFASSVARHFGCKEDAVEDLKLAISETVAFASRASISPKPIRITMAAADEHITIEVQHADGFGSLIDPPGQLDPPSEFGLAVLRSLFPDMTAGRMSEVTCVRFGLTLSE